MYDYNSKSNEKEVKEAALTWSIIFFLATSIGQETGIIQYPWAFLCENSNKDPTAQGY